MYDLTSILPYISVNWISLVCLYVCVCVCEHVVCVCIYAFITLDMHHLDNCSTRHLFATITVHQHTLSTCTIYMQLCTDTLMCYM